jgi:protein gp37
VKKHKIGWLNVLGHVPQTWNPIVGCSKISEGCRNCYAERMAFRLAMMSLKNPEEALCAYRKAICNCKWTGQTYLVKSALEKPLHWKKPRAIFVNSMGDLFHENTSVLEIDEVFRIIRQCPQHLFIVLTKRSERMMEFFQRHYKTPIQNLWLGVTAENQAAADERIPHLLNTPAAVRFVSCEPLIGDIDLCIPVGCRSCNHPGNVRQREGCTRCGGSGREPTLDWVICGGESGPGARPMNPEWARSLRGQCISADVHFFFKQWGDAECNEQCQWNAGRLGEKHGGDELDERLWHEFPIIGKGGAQ